MKNAQYYKDSIKQLQSTIQSTRGKERVLLVKAIRHAKSKIVQLAVALMVLVTLTGCLENTLVGVSKDTLNHENRVLNKRTRNAFKANGNAHAVKVQNLKQSSKWLDLMEDSFAEFNQDK
jgi:hypothetical protein